MATTNYLLPQENLPQGRSGRRKVAEVGRRLRTLAERLPTASTLADAKKQQHNACEICNGLGWFTYDVQPGHALFGKAQVCACQNSTMHARLQALSGQSAAEMLVRLADIDATAGPGTTMMVAEARAFVGHPVAMLTITGSCGNGKSDVLHAIVNECIGRHVEAVYATIFDLMGWVKEAFNDSGGVKSESAYSRIKQLERVRVLCIDEFDKLQRTPWMVEQMTDLVDARHRYGLDGVLGTVIAANAGIETLPDWICSRLKDGRNRRVVNNDADMRPLMER